MVVMLERIDTVAQTGGKSPHFTLWEDGSATIFGRRCRRDGNRWFLSQEDSDLMEEIVPDPCWGLELQKVVTSAIDSLQGVSYVIMHWEAAIFLYLEGLITDHQLREAPGNDDQFLAIDMFVCGEQIEVDFSLTVNGDEYGAYFVVD